MDFYFSGYPRQRITALETGKQDKVITVNHEATMGESGTITSGNTSSLTDISKTWTVNQHVNKVVRVLIGASDWFYAVVASNTSNTLTFDDVALVTASGTYTILDTVQATTNSIIALNIINYPCAVLLPESNESNERQFIHIYVEKAINGNQIVPIICRGSQRIRQLKYLTLDNIYEGVRVYPHTWISGHWDLLLIENVKRYLAAHRTLQETVNVGDFGILSTEGNFTIDFKNRFVPIVKSGKGWFRYTSIVSNLFVVNAVFNLIKSGGNVSNVALAIRVYRYATGITEDYTDVEASIKFVVAESKQALFNIPILLNHNDEVTVIGKTDTATITVLPGSNIIISEL